MRLLFVLIVVLMSFLIPLSIGKKKCGKCDLVNYGGECIENGSQCNHNRQCCNKHCVKCECTTSSASSSDESVTIQDSQGGCSICTKTCKERFGNKAESSGCMKLENGSSECKCVKDTIGPPP